MKRSILTAGVATIALALCGMLDAAIAIEKEHKSVPFKGDIQASVERTIVFPIAHVELDGSGQATHLGNFSVSAPHDVDLTTRTASGTYTFTAANGDELYAEFTGRSTPIAGTANLSIVEEATITGGTGRFADATGSFTVEREFDTLAESTTGSFDGTISFSHGDHD